MNDPQQPLRFPRQISAPARALPNRQGILPRPARRASPIFFQKDPGSLGNRAIIDIPTARTELLGCCKATKMPFGPIRIELGASKFSLEARDSVNSWAILTEGLQLETALQRILGQDDVAVWTREIKLVINRWNMYEPIRPASLRLSGRHFIKEHSASTSSGERNIA